MPKKSNTNEFIIKAKLIHNDKYDYDKSNYTGAKTPIIIICKIHGEFLQKPNTHLNGAGCPDCGRISCHENHKIDFDDWLEEAISVHGTTYDYCKVNATWDGVTSDIEIICKIHGSFFQKAWNHTNGQGCRLCGFEKSKNQPHRLTNAEFIARSKAIFGNRCDYSKTEYISLKKKVILICNYCRTEYTQIPLNHIINQSYGCPTCSHAYNIAPIANVNNFEEITLYFVKLYNADETFCKIGITKKVISQRFKSTDIFNLYNYELIAERQMTHIEALKAEQDFKINFLKYRYIPKNKFGGYTECFDISLVKILFPDSDIV